MLEHVGEQPELVAGVGEGQPRAVEHRDAFDLRPGARDRRSSLRDLGASEHAAEVAAVQLAQQGAVPAPDLERVRWIQSGPRAQLDHVVGLANGPQGAPAPVQRRL